jgi:hypothetical protein
MNPGGIGASQVASDGAISSCQELVVADIMIKCPLFGIPVPTGVTRDIIVLDTLEFSLTMHCPACRKIHRWTRRDAWVASR